MRRQADANIFPDFALLSAQDLEDLAILVGHQYFIVLHPGHRLRLASPRKPQTSFHLGIDQTLRAYPEKV